MQSRHLQDVVEEILIRKQGSLQVIRHNKRIFIVRCIDQGYASLNSDRGIIVIITENYVYFLQVL